jgi:hypothetical protein
MSTSHSLSILGNTIGALLVSASLVSAAEKPPEKVTFEEHIKPLFRNSCLNCHNPEKKKSGLDMTTYQGLMQGSDNGKVIVPGDPDKSVLFKCVTFADDPKMPPKSDKLSDPELDLIKKFIELGAPENAGSKIVVMKGAAPAVVSTDEKAPDGPPPMPKDLLLEPVVRASRPGQISALAASRWAPLVAVAGQKQVLLYNTDTLEPAGVLPFPEGFPYVLKFSRNCQLLLAGGGVGANYGRVVVWDVVTGERVLEAGDETDAVLAADISPDHSRIVLGGPSKWLKVFSGKDGSPIKQIKKHTDWVTAVAFSPDGKYLVTADRSGNAYVWDSSIRELWSLTGHKGPITAVSVSGNVAATASEDGTVKTWDLKTGESIKSFTAHNGGVESVEFTRDGKLITCGRDKLTKIFDATGKLEQTFPELPDVALHATFTGGKVIAGDWTGVVRVWNAADAKPGGDLSANPPSLADRIDATTKRISELQTAKEKSAGEIANAENAAKQATAEIDTANKTAAQAEANFKTSDAQLAAAKKAADDATASQKKAQDDFIYKQMFAQAAAQAATQAKDASTKADPANADEVKRLAEAAAKAADAAKQANDVLNTAKLALDAQNAALAKARAQADAAAVALNKSKADSEAAKQNVAAKSKTAQQANESLAKSKQAAEQTVAQLAAAKTDLGKWKAAQVNTSLLAARSELAKIEPEYNRAAEADKGAVSAVEQARADVAGVEAFLASAPEKIKAAEKTLASARTTFDAAQSAGKDTKEAAMKRDAAEHALAKLNADVQSAPEQLHKFRAAVQEASAQAANTRTEATKTLADLQPRVAVAKAKVEKLKNEYEAAKNEAMMIASQKK